MATIGTILQKHSRSYIYLNPNPALGPSTWRLSNIGEGVEYTYIENLYTIAPIAKVQTSSAVVLKFDINSIPKNVYEPNTPGTPSLEQLAEDIINSKPPGGYSPLALETISAVNPMYRKQIDRDVTVWFEIKPLAPINAPFLLKDKMRVTLGTGYNSISVTSLAAEEPIHSNTIGKEATISFDIKTLDPV